MNYHFNEAIAADYRSNSQKIRVMSENWAWENLYCPCCGNPRLTKLENNRPVSDFQCGYCGETFELKSKQGQISKKIADGAYDTMIERITSATNPDLLVLQYSQALDVTDLLVIPKFFFVPSVIEKRKPLSPSAHRAGWVGCNILISEIPVQGRIEVISHQVQADAKAVVQKYNRIKALQTNSIESRGWLFDVLNCINRIDQADFCLSDVYAYADELQQKYPENHNIKAKIRQQLQVLRDKGIIAFTGNGTYKKLE